MPGSATPKGTSRICEPNVKAISSRAGSSCGGASAGKPITVTSAAGGEPGEQRHTAVDVDRGPHDVIAEIGRQHGDRVRDVIRVADTLIRDEPEQFGLGLRGIPRAAVDG